MAAFCMQALVGTLPAARAPRAAPKRASPLAVPSFEGGLRRSAGLGEASGARPARRVRPLRSRLRDARALRVPPRRPAGLPRWPANQGFGCSAGWGLAQPPRWAR